MHSSLLHQIIHSPPSLSMVDWLPIVYSESSVGNKVLELFVLGFFYTNSKLASLPSLDGDDQPNKYFYKKDTFICVLSRLINFFLPCLLFGDDLSGSLIQNLFDKDSVDNDCFVCLFHFLFFTLFLTFQSHFLSHFIFWLGGYCLFWKRKRAAGPSETALFKGASIREKEMIILESNLESGFRNWPK